MCKDRKNYCKRRLISLLVRWIPHCRYWRCITEWQKRSYRLFCLLIMLPVMFCAIVSSPKRLQINNPRSNMRFIIHDYFKITQRKWFFFNVQIFPGFYWNSFRFHKFRKDDLKCGKELSDWLIESSPGKVSVFCQLCQSLFKPI